MALLKLTDVRRVFASGGGVRGVSLMIEDGEFIVILGPSGCGKSTLLRIIAGLDPPQSGTIEFDADRVNRGRAQVAMVFQNLALYPHLSARQNIAFPLRIARTEPDEIDRRVRATAAKCGLAHGLDRRPGELSGGERQRVALARALVRDPDIVLMDEAMASLDARLRADLRIELKQLQRISGISFVYVTHDQAEALAIADRIAVMRDGQIEQIGSPEEIFNRPATEFVAAFVGEPAMNLFDARVADGAVVFGGAACPITLPGGAPAALRAGIRPGDLTLNGGEGALSFPVIVRSVEFASTSFVVRAVIARSDTSDATVCALLSQRVEPGSATRFFFDPARLHLFDAASRRRINFTLTSPGVA